MLNLVRKCDQSITIGADVQIKVLRIAGKSVKLGITSPEGVTVRRVTDQHSLPETKAEYLDESVSD